jgi:hypothetical protein
MTKLKEMSFGELVELIDYLDSVSEGGTQAFIGRFFPNLTAVQELELGYVIDSRDEKAFEKFRSDYPDMDIDPEGRSEPSEKRYWEIGERSLNYTYDLALAYLKSRNFREDIPNKPNTQIYNARTLAFLKNMPWQDPSFYVGRKKLFMDKNGRGPLSPERVSEAESKLRSLGVPPNKFMTYLFSYCENKKYENYRVVVDHLFRRIDILSEDKDLSSQSNRDFLDAIKSISEKNN